MSATIRRAVLAALAALALIAPAADAKPRKHHAKPSNVTVMSRNIYLGGNIFGPLVAQTPAQFQQLAGVLWAEVQKTDFPTRAKLLAREIKRVKPDLIGLQEVATWRRSPGAGDGQATPSTQVVYDFLQILRAELKRAGLRYKVGSQQAEADIEAQIDAGYDIRLTMHDVILVKQRKGLKVTKRSGKNYAFKLTVPTQGGPLTSQRGWTAVDGKLDGKPFRLVNTHLEAALDAARDAQAAELVVEHRAAAHQEAAIRHRRHELRSAGTRVDRQRLRHPHGGGAGGRLDPAEGQRSGLHLLPRQLGPERHDPSRLRPSHRLRVRATEAEGAQGLGRRQDARRARPERPLAVRPRRRGGQVQAEEVGEKSVFELGRAHMGAAEEPLRLRCIGICACSAG